nr:hypothetical protein BaRGS_022478 [Batillaria attramentaria]
MYVGILTASVYNNQEDVPLTGIRGRAQRVLVVKTHNLDKLPFSLDRYVIIIRNPYDCLLAAFNRRSEAGVPFQQHIAHQPKEAFLDEWDTFVDGSMKHWSSNYLNWSKLQKPVHLLVYHRLLAQLEPELRDVIDFLHEPSIHPMIHCAARDKEGDAHRQKEEWQEKFAVFSHKQKRYLNDAIDTVQEAWEKRTGKNFADFQKWKRP